MSVVIGDVLYSLELVFAFSLEFFRQEIGSCGTSRQAGPFFAGPPVTKVRIVYKVCFGFALQADSEYPRGDSVIYLINCPPNGNDLRCVLS